MLRSFFSKISLPVIKELPIILVYFILIKTCFIEFFLDNDYDGVWDYLSVFSIWFLYAYIIAASIYFSKKVWLRYLWYIFLFSIFATSIFIAANFEMKISPTLITLLIETDGRETQEFINTYFFTHASVIVYLKLFIYIIFAILLELGYRKYVINRLIFSGNIYCSLLICVLLTMGILRWVQFSAFFDFKNPEAAEDMAFPSNDIYTRLLCSILIESKQSVIIKKAVDVSLKSNNITTSSAETDSLNLVFVIGESFNKSHAGIYGYQLQTTPNLCLQEKNGNLFKYTDVVTPYNYTSMAVKNIMSCNNIANSEQWYNYPFFPSLFKKAGYDVYFWSNQHEDAEGTVFEYALNSYLFNDTLSRYTYNSINSKAFQYDGQLIDNFFEAPIRKKSNNLFMFHLMGQHTAFYARFPHTKKHQRFTIKDIHRDESYLDEFRLQQIAYYDNAVLYNDYVLSKLFDYFKDTNTALIFLSDHGEEVFDYRDRMGRSYTDSIDSLYIKYQFEIPFVIWCSDKFKEKNQDVMKSIEESLSEPFMIDDVCHLFFHLGKIQTEYYHPERDILSSKHVRKDRMIRGGDINYDKFGCQ